MPSSAAPPTAPSLGQSQPRLKIHEALKMHRLSLDDVMDEKVVPACCAKGCTTQREGYCAHGFPSVLIVLASIS